MVSERSPVEEEMLSERSPVEEEMVSERSPVEEEIVRIGGSPSYDRRGCRRCPERGHREQNTRDGERVCYCEWRSLF